MASSVRRAPTRAAENDLGAKGGHYTGPQLMRSRLVWRRSATALGIYGSTALGVLGTVVAARVLGPDDFGRFAIVIATVGLFQLLLDLTSEEALVKYCFRYSAREDWGRFRRLFGVTLGLKSAAAVVAGVVVLALAPFGDDVFGTHGLAAPLALAALLPFLYSIEGIAASALILRGRYDVRAGFIFLAMAVRLAAIAVGTPHGVTTTVALLVLGQAMTTTALASVGLAALRRFPPGPAVPLAEDRPEVVRFVLQSSAGTGLISLRGFIGPLLLGIVSDVRQVGYFRAAQAPQQGFAALSSPVRLILLTDQTRDWEHGRPEAVFAGLRRYVLGSAALMAVVLVPFWLLMPWLIEVVLPDYTQATDAARVILVAAAIQLVYGWTKSLPVSIGRPNLRIVAHGIETVVLVPSIVVLGREWGATGAAVAMLAATVVFAAVWTILVLRLRKEPLPQAPLGTPIPAPESVA
jgi:O-antigen/teichoic acid export membrane protein